MLDMSRIRVAMMAPPWVSIPPKGYGGIENVLAALVPALLDLDVDVELFATGDSTIKTTKSHWLYPKGQYKHIHKAGYDSMPISFAQVLFSLNKIRKDGKFDIIHDHNGFVGPLAFALGGGDLPPAIHTLHGPPFSRADRLKIGIPDNLPMWKEFKNIRDLYFVPISQSLIKSAPAAIRRFMLPPIHNAIDIRQFPFVAEKDDYFITLGRFHPEKGQAIAVRAAEELGVKLKMAGVVGDISDPKKLLLELANPLSSYRSLADFRYYSDYIFPYLLSGRIENIGEVEGKKKMDFISHAKAMLFPITWDEPFGMVAIEALACGTPVISMARGALPEIIEHGVNGFLAKNEREFKEYMKRVDEIDPAACRESVERKFSAEIMAKNYLEDYKKVIAKTKGSIKGVGKSLYERM
jgi:glycosyltransferase involved in cell wall biosynthesis